MAAFLIGAVLEFLGVALVFMRRKEQSKLLEIKDVKTATAKELNDLSREIRQELGSPGFTELAEVKGVVRCDQPLKGELSGQSCVFYEMLVEERYEETYYEKDSQGNRRQKTRTGTSTVASNRQMIRFEVEDSTGRVEVDPAGAEMDSVEVLDRFQPGAAAGNRLQWGDFSAPVSGTTAGRKILGYRYVEKILPLERPVYVLGEVSDRDGTLRIGNPAEKEKPFVISLKTEAELVRGVESRIRGMLYGAIFCFAAGLAALVYGAFQSGIL